MQPRKSFKLKRKNLHRFADFAKKVPSLKILTEVYEDVFGIELRLADEPK